MKNNMAFKAISICVVMVAGMVMSTGCSMHHERVQHGLNYARGEQYDKAEAYFAEMARKYPAKAEYRMLLLRTRMKRYYAHLYRARALREAGKDNEAVAAYRSALEVFPANRKLQEELDEFVGREAEKEAEGFRSRIKPPVQLTVNPDEKVNLKLRSMPITKIFKALGRSFGINFVFDKDFRDFVYSLDVDNVGFYQVLNQLALVAGAKFRPLDPSTLLVYADSPYKNRAYGLNGVRVFTLSSLKAEEAKKLIMSVFRESRPTVQEHAPQNTLIVKADIETLQGIEHFLSQVDKAKPEVELDVQILEVNRNLLHEIGSNFGSSLFELSMGNEDSDGAVSQTFRMDRLGDTNFFMTVPSVAMSLLETTGDSKLLAKPNLRGIQGEEISFMVGDKIPIPQTQFQSFAAGGVNNTPVTTYRYEEIGVEIKITPFVHQNDEVTLEIELSMTFVTSYVDQFPVMGKREIKNTIRLKEGETNLIGGFIRDEERNSMQGIPFISRLPILGKLFGNQNRNIDQTDLLFSISPRVIRRPRILKGDRSTIWMNSFSGGATGGGSAGQEEASRTRPPNARPQPAASRSGGQGIVLTPASRRVKVGTPVLYSLRLSGMEKPVARLSMAGDIASGGAEIVGINTEFLTSENAKVLKNFTADGFDLGYTFTPPRKRGMVAQIQVKFAEKGNHPLRISSLEAYAEDGSVIEVSLPPPASVEVN